MQIQQELEQMPNRGIKQRLTHLVTPREGEEVDPLGLPIRMHYILFSFSSAVMGGFPLLLTFTSQNEQMYVWPLRAFCAVGILLSWGYYAVGKRVQFRKDERLYHFGAIASNLLIGIGAFCVGDLHGPMSSTVLIAPIAVGYYLSFWKSLPHVVWAAGILIAASTLTVDPASALFIVTMLIVMVSGWLMVLSTKNHLVAVLDKHRVLSETDPLTGAANVRRLQTLLDDEVARSGRGGDGFALIAFDLDEFKQANDRYSHTMGDSVLVATVEAVRTQLAATDTLVRRGGDEFSIVAPTITGRNLQDLCAGIGDVIAVARRQLCPDVKPTGSIGYVVHRPDETVAELVQRADQAVHDAKLDSRAKIAPVAIAIGTADAAHSVGSPTAATSDKRSPTDQPEHQKAADPVARATAFAWSQAAVLFVTVTAAYGLLAFTGATDLHVTPATIILSLVSFALAPVCWRMSKMRGSSTAMTHALTVGSLVVIGLVGFANPSAAVDSAELFLLPILFQMYLLPTRTAIIYAGVTLALLTTVLAAHGYDQTILRANSDLNAIALVAVILAFSRRRTIETALDNLELARIDALTGMPNLRRLRNRLEDEIRRCETSGDRFSLLMLDLDDFKSVNDIYGHSRGDMVLTSVAAKISSIVRKAEMPARRGGDEFAVVLTDTARTDADRASERFGAAIANVRAEICPDIIPTASLGCAAWEPGDDVDDLLAKADDALHTAKLIAHAERAIVRESLAASVATHSDRQAGAA